MGMNGRDTAAPISVIGRAMTVLTSYRATDDGLSLAEITRRTGLAKPTIHRLLGELQTWGLVERTDGVWRLGLQLFELGQMPPRQPLPRILGHEPQLARAVRLDELNPHASIFPGQHP